MEFYNGGGHKMKLISIDLPPKVFGIDSAMITSFIPLVLVVLGVVIGTNLLILPRIYSYQEMSQKLADTKSKSKNLLDKVTYLQSVDSSELKKNAAFITYALLPQKSAYFLVNMVRKISDEHGFQVDSFLINPGKIDKAEVAVKQSSDVPKIPIRVSLIGAKEGYLGLIKALEKSLPILSLGSYKMTTQGNLVKIDLDISAYYLNEIPKFEINKLSLAELTLDKSESDLITSINQFVPIAGENTSQSTDKVELKKYNRADPFSL